MKLTELVRKLQTPRAPAPRPAPAASPIVRLQGSVSDCVERLERELKDLPGDMLLRVSVIMPFTEGSMEDFIECLDRKWFRVVQKKFFPGKPDMWLMDIGCVEVMAGDP